MEKTLDKGIPICYNISVIDTKSIMLAKTRKKEALLMKRIKTIYFCNADMAKCREGGEF